MSDKRKSYNEMDIAKAEQFADSFVEDVVSGKRSGFSDALDGTDIEDRSYAVACYLDGLMNAIGNIGRSLMGRKK